jgi:hypothetical protein
MQDFVWLGYQLLYVHASFYISDIVGHCQTRDTYTDILTILKTLIFCNKYEKAYVGFGIRLDMIFLNCFSCLKK